MSKPSESHSVEELPIIKNVTSLRDYQSCIETGACVIKFSAEWCRPCHKMHSPYEKIAIDNPSIKFLNIDIDKSPDIVGYETIKSIPLIMFYNNGMKKEQLTVSGFNPELLAQNVDIFIS
jgi:thioredoxin-like negative regulator of GroEL